MPEQELRRRLEELHRELENVGEIDAEMGTLLEEVRGEIEAVIERSGPHTLGDRLGEIVERFEVSHPKLASAMGAVIDQLAHIGV